MPSSSLHYRGQRPITESIGIQMRVIGALLMREILDRFGRHNLGFLWMFVEPMVFTLSVTSLWTIIGLNHGSDLPIVAFAVTGYSAVLLWRNMPSRCVKAVQPNHTLMHHRNIKLIDIYSARLLLEAGGATISFTLLTVLFNGFGWMAFPEDTLKVFFGWIMMAWFGCSLAPVCGRAERTGRDRSRHLASPSLTSCFPSRAPRFRWMRCRTLFKMRFCYFPWCTVWKSSVRATSEATTTRTITWRTWPPGISS